MGTGTGERAGGENRCGVDKRGGKGGSGDEVNSGGLKGIKGDRGGGNGVFFIIIGVQNGMLLMGSLSCGVASGSLNANPWTRLPT